MFVSQFDQRSHTFQCQNVKCRKEFEIVLRQLLKADHVDCPKCGHAISILDSKKKGTIRRDLDAADKADNAARRKEKET
jgi:DNA-directed RNA polymerase subunit RPC12/RpoP